MPSEISNLLTLAKSTQNSEQIDFLLQTSNFRLRRIASYATSSPIDFWYDQDEPEWILLAQGEATLVFEDKEVELKSGDYLLIPAHEKHRVESCSENAIWLALFFNA